MTEFTLSDTEFRDLSLCIPFGEQYADAGKRTGHISKRLLDAKFVAPLMFVDGKAQEVVLSWQRTLAGQSLFRQLLADKQDA